MAKVKNNYMECLDILKKLKKDHPAKGIAQHIYGATVDYGEIWGMTDKEFIFALNKYIAELDFDLDNETSIAKIIADASNEKLFQLEEEDDDGDD